MNDDDRGWHARLVDRGASRSGPASVSQAERWRVDRDGRSAFVSDVAQRIMFRFCGAGFASMPVRVITIPRHKRFRVMTTRTMGTIERSWMLSLSHGNCDAMPLPVPAARCGPDVAGIREAATLRLVRVSVSGSAAGSQARSWNKKRAGWIICEAILSHSNMAEQGALRRTCIQRAHSSRCVGMVQLL